MVGTKVLLFGILGLAGIAIVNFAFFKMIRKTFKDRKLIWFAFIILLSFMHGCQSYGKGNIGRI